MAAELIEGRLDDIEPLAFQSEYEERIATTAGLLANQLMFGSDRSGNDKVNGAPVSISVAIDRRNPVGGARLYGAVLDAMPPEGGSGAYVGVEAHSISGCGAGRQHVARSPAADIMSRGIRGMAYATPHLAEGRGWRLDDAFLAAYDGASGYGDSRAPRDPRNDEQAMAALVYFRQMGHTFLHPILEQYAADLAGPANLR